jgi:alanine dehydrogenase
LAAFCWLTVTHRADTSDHEPGALFISEADVRALLGLDRAIDVLWETYREQARNSVLGMQRAHLRIGDAILHAVGGVLVERGVAGVKTWLYTPHGAQPLLMLYAVADGRLLAVVEAFLLGQMRTAATSGLATRLLSREDADSLALLGTGKQAQPQAAAVCAVREIARIALYGRDADRRAALADRLRAQHEVVVDEVDAVGAALEGAAVVTAVTRASDPLVTGDLLEPGMHVNAVGAITPDRSELDADAITRFDVLVADSVTQARADAGDLRAAAAAGAIAWGDVHGLDDVAAGIAAGRVRPSDLTLFRALGVGSSDVALGCEVIARAREHGRGLVLPASRDQHFVTHAPQAGGVHG